MATFEAYTGTDNSALTSALLVKDSLGNNISGIQIVTNSVTLKASGDTAVNYYDGSLTALGIGSGLLLTSGTTPGTSNTVGWFGQDNSIWPDTFYNGDPLIDAVVNTVFQTQSYDATMLSFDFTVTDPGATSVSFDIVFGSDEYPEWVDQFVDCAVVTVNGVNYAYFNHDPNSPLSVISSNLAAGYFQDNSGNILPIEYDGVSNVLKIVAPINAGQVNSITIGIADTGDHIYDSGIFIANLSAGTIPGSGVVANPDSPCTDNSDSVTGKAQSEYFDLLGGDDIAYAGAGDDIIVAGSGQDTVYGGSGDDEMKGDAGNDLLDGGDGTDTAVYSGVSTGYTVSVNGSTYSIVDVGGAGAEGTDTLTSIEQVKFSDGLFALGPGGLTAVTGPGSGPVNAPGVAVITGIGSEGKTLTAHVSDADGIPSAPGTIAYEWQVSADNGATWETVATGSADYTVAVGDAGKSIQVIATYIDNAGQAELAVSPAKAILETGGGDLIVTLMNLDAPIGASVINPLTTLIENAIELGVSPNLATLIIRDTLGLPSNVNLLTYDAYSILQSQPNNATALAVEMVAVQVAILTSLSDDDSGMNLTVAILNAAASGTTLDLADLNVLSDILGIAPVIDPATGKYPQPLDEIHDRNAAMADAIADGDGISAIEKEWQDLLSIQDGIASTSIADLSIHVNQAPIGFATAELAPGDADTPYLIDVADLLAGFSDPDGDALSVSSLYSDKGSITDNGDGTFTFTPAPGYSGPVELTYAVDDGQGGMASGSQMLVIQSGSAANTPPAGSATSELSAGLENTNYIVSAADLLAGFSDADGDTLSVQGLSADHGTVTDNGDGTYTISPEAGYTGTVTLSYDVTDGVDSIAASQSFVLDPVPGLTLTGTSGADTMLGGAGDDVLSGLAGNDSMSGMAGDDRLDGGSGNDTMVGGTGSDTYVAGSSGDIVDETGGDGTDTVESTVTFSLSIATQVKGDVENLTLIGTATIRGTGNALDNAITGNAGNNILTGLGGADALDGGLGIDTASYAASGAGVTVSLLTGTGSGGDAEGDTLTGIENLTGSAFADLLEGDAGNNVLAGGLGNDTVTYAAAVAGVTVNLAVTIAQDTLGAGVDRLLSIENLTGSAFDDVLTGSSAANILIGGEGNDVINGGSGNDTMVGGTSNDTYVVGSSGDIVDETGSDGTDTVESTVTFSLSSATQVKGDVENLTLLGAKTINGTGNALDNAITGNDGNNVLTGLGGADALDGGLGIDTASYAASGSGVTVSLLTGTGSGGDAEGDTLTGIENLSGSVFNDMLEGDAGNNVLLGGFGNDTMSGGHGADLLTGGRGADHFVFSSLADAGDVVTDFARGTDKIALSLLLQSESLETLTVTDLISGGYLQTATGYFATGTATNSGTILDTQVLFDADGIAGPGLAIVIGTFEDAAIGWGDFVI